MAGFFVSIDAKPMQVLLCRLFIEDGERFGQYYSYAKTLVTTPNSDVIYAMGYVDLGKDGPLVIEVPPRQQGSLDDFWGRSTVTVS
jgi:hypothetical protein